MFAFFVAVYKRQRAAHAEANDADLFASGRIVVRKVFDGRAEIFFSLVDAQRHHQLARFVRRLGRFAVIEIRRECDKTFGRERSQTSLM